MKRILLLTDVFPPKTGGSGRWFWEVYRRLQADEVLIAAGQDPRQDAFDRTHNVSVQRVPLTFPNWGLSNRRGLGGYTRAFRCLRKLVHSFRPEQIHAGRVLPEGLLAWMLKRWFGLPYLFYVHGEEVDCFGSRELRWLARRVVSGADLLIANSRNTERIIHQHWKVAPQRIRIVNPGVDTTRFQPAPRDLAVRSRLGWGDRPVILTAGRLQKRKGQDMLIQALPFIRQHLPNVLYAIVGDGDQRAALETLVSQENVGDHVLFMGECDDATLVSSYQQCDLFVLPNRQVGSDIEGFGMVLVEAQACGKPVLAGASGGTAETMSIPETGQVIDCTTPDLLSTTIADWLRDPSALALKSQKARTWAVEQFDWEAITRRSLDLFAELPGAPSSRHVVGASKQ